ncbi:hypothetical protein [Devosia sp. CN2-171]|uniref:hypothetical protein n=1 Tax=Devosia sp. CN2-171 TaxID=3400909 RepID=UPI003BF8DA82
MLADDDKRWDLVRLQVKAGEMTRNRICAEHGITTQRLAQQIRKNKWDVDEDATEHDRRIIIGELFLATELQVLRLLGAQMSETGERESALLGRLTTTLDRLISLDVRVTGKKPTQRQSKEMTELRAKIAKRLDELKVR